MSYNYSSVNWTELYGGKPILISSCEPDPNSSHEDYYYNSSENKLYKLIKILNCTHKITTKKWKLLTKPTC